MSRFVPCCPLPRSALRATMPSANPNRDRTAANQLAFPCVRVPHSAVQITVWNAQRPTGDWHWAFIFCAAKCEKSLASPSRICAASFLIPRCRIFIGHAMSSVALGCAAEHTASAGVFARVAIGPVGRGFSRRDGLGGIIRVVVLILRRGGFGRGGRSLEPDFGKFTVDSRWLCTISRTCLITCPSAQKPFYPRPCCV